MLLVAAARRTRPTPTTADGLQAVPVLIPTSFVRFVLFVLVHAPASLQRDAVQMHKHFAR